LNEAFTGGWTRGKLYLLAGPPETGKTTFCAWAADHAARNQIPVLYISFELSKSQLWLNGIARAARLDSRTIESQPWQNLPPEQSGHVHKQVQSAIGSYTQLAKHLNVVEARPGTPVFDLRPAITRVRNHYKLAMDAPVLVIVDAINSLGTGISEIDFGSDTGLKIERVIVALKQLAREMNTPVLAITPTSSAVSVEMDTNGEVPAETLKKESWFHSAADTVMVLASNEINGGDQLQLLINRYRENQGVLTRLRQIREDSPSDPSGLERSTYSRLTVLKNRGGVRSELLFLYQRAFHNFIPFDLLLELSR
jgi:replicative DNA helicase